MPLYSQNGEGAVNHPFDYVVPRAADGNQPFAYAVYGLMMGGVYSGAVSVELVKEIGWNWSRPIHLWESAVSMCCVISPPK